MSFETGEAARSLSSLNSDLSSTMPKQHDARRYIWCGRFVDRRCAKTSNVDSA